MHLIYWRWKILCSGCLISYTLFPRLGIDSRARVNTRMCLTRHVCASVKLHVSCTLHNASLFKTSCIHEFTSRINTSTPIYSLCNICWKHVICARFGCDHARQCYSYTCTAIWLMNDSLCMLWGSSTQSPSKPLHAHAECTLLRTWLTTSLLKSKSNWCVSSYCTDSPKGFLHVETAKNYAREYQVLSTPYQLHTAAVQCTYTFSGDRLRAAALQCTYTLVSL